MEPVLEMVDAPPSLSSRPELSLGAVIARTFSVWSRNLVVFSSVSLIVHLPLILLAVAGIGQTTRREGPGGALLVSFLESVLGLVTQGALTAGVLQALRGERVGAGRILGFGLRKLLPLLLVSFMVGLVVGCGTLLLVVPGLFALSGLYLAVPVLVSEGCSTSDSIGRSWDLSRGRRWKLLAVALLFQLGAAAVLIACGALIGGIAAAWTGRVGNLAYGMIQVVGALVITVSLVAPAVAYHDLRIEKEGVSTEQLAAVFE